MFAGLARFAFLVGFALLLALPSAAQPDADAFTQIMEAIGLGPLKSTIADSALVGHRAASAPAFDLLPRSGREEDRPR
jgi:hypothetical protein